MATTSLLWHDYETWGSDPRSDFPSQFAAIRTDLELNIIDEPVVLYAAPPVDRLPSPEACMIIRQTPQRILAQDCVTEYEFIKQINALMSEPGTCTLGYNNLRFDDEVTRFSLYRNFFDPYAREWQNGCSRWDMLDVVRMTRALRPSGINWPKNGEGRPSAKLEDLTMANNIEHSQAHDALADVRATIEIARIIKTKKPKLYNYAFSTRDKKSAANMLKLTDPEMIVHISGMYKAECGNMAVVAPIAQDPANKNAIAVYDLRFAPDILKTDDIEYLNYLLFTKQDELKDNEVRLPIKTIHINKCPVITPLSTLNEEVTSRYDIDLELCKDNFYKLTAITGLEDKIQKVLAVEKFPPEQDPEKSLYQDFFSDYDRKLSDRFRRTTAKNMELESFGFKDPRLPELAFRFKARNYPNYLSSAEKSRWQEFCNNKIRNDHKFNLADYRKELSDFGNNRDLSAEDLEIIAELEDWPEQILA